ncbi:related to clp1, essential for A-regulated sexual development [Ustilago trichophora]|uniref:Related to clp1, essential for A-regulated sexual development n=1 Tax=Ustilago trichophora TaxID=86804 RepID=A0A5C3EPK0_9BASI|nr:related to clp1, essential for A-regulated sexual development [Ustilago trichophora]
MIMSPASQTAFHPHTTKASSFSCGSSARNMSSSKTTVKIPSSVCNKLTSAPCAAMVAVKQLDKKPSPSPLSSARSPLQPVDVNLSKVDRQQASRSRCSSSAPSSKITTSRPPTKKVRSPSSKDVATGSQSANKANKLGFLLGHSASVTLKGERISVKVPQRLPTPRLKPNSSPYEDLVAHLSRHHFFAEAQEVERSSITPDFYLTQYLESARLGKCSLYHQTLNFLDANRDNIMASVIPGQSLPESVPLDVTAWVDTFQRPPTHLLAVHSDSEAATLYAVHGQVLALQCVSIPFLPASKESTENGKTIKNMSTLALRVPSLQHFNTILRWLYSQSTTSLLQELLPLQHIITYLAKRPLAATTASKSPVSDDKPSLDVAKLSPNDLVEAMSTMSTKTFLELLQTIQAVWKNGVALGIVSWNFWTVLDNAWNLIIGAMIRSKRRSQIKGVSASANEIVAQLRSTRIE